MSKDLVGRRICDFRIYHTRKIHTNTVPVLEDTVKILVKTWCQGESSRRLADITRAMRSVFIGALDHNRLLLAGISTTVKLKNGYMH